MIKAIFFDCDGIIIKRDKYFSQRLREEKGLVIDPEGESSFFKGEFLLCKTGKADLKKVLPKWLLVWKWPGTVDEFLEYWFSGETEVEELMLNYIQGLRHKGVRCYLATNNEKYRVKYLWEDAGLKNYFDGYFASSDLGYLKDCGEFWEGALKISDSDNPSEVLVWDDDKKNVESAKACGLMAELYSDFDAFKSKLKEYGFN